MTDPKPANTKPPLLAWDTCVVIAALCKNRTPHDKWWPHIEPMHKDAEDGKCRLLISEIVVAECCVGRSPKSKEDKYREDTDAFFYSRYIDRRDVDGRVSALARKYVQDLQVGTCDAIIIANAVIHKADALYTTDGAADDGTIGKMLALDGKIPGIRIIKPDAAIYMKMPLFTKPGPL